MNMLIQKFVACVISLLAVIGYSGSYTLSQSSSFYSGHSAKGGGGVDTWSSSYYVDVPSGFIANVRIDKINERLAHCGSIQVKVLVNGSKVNGEIFGRNYLFTSSGSISISASASADISWREPIYYTHPTLGPIISYWVDHYYTTYYYQVNYNISVTYSKAYPDLSATASVSPSPYAAIEEPVKLKFTVRNSGYNASGASVAKIYDEGDNLKGTVQIGALSVGRTESHEVTLSGLTVGSNQTFRVVADANNDVEESNESNNGKSISVNIYSKTARNVRFFANGGYGTMPAQSIVCGTPIALSLNKFTRDDYVFSGWATTPSGGVTYKDGADILTYYDDVDLYAVWNAKTCSITFKDSDNEITTRSYSVISPCGPNLPTTQKTNCEFIGWFTEPNGGVQITSNTVFKADCTLYAKFEKSRISLKLHSGTGDVAEYILYAGENVIPSNPFIRDGYKFVGWAENKDEANDKFKSAYENEELCSFYENIELYAVWSEIITCKFEANGGVGEMPDIIMSRSDYMTPECKFTKEGDAFTRWEISEIDGVKRHIAQWGGGRVDGVYFYRGYEICDGKKVPLDSKARYVNKL